MATRSVIDSDVDVITALAIKGVNAFMASYVVDEPVRKPVSKSVVAAGPRVPVTRVKKTSSRRR